MTASPNAGLHPTVGQSSCLRVDACVQVWPGADFASLRRRPVTAHGVTAVRPRQGFEEACEALMQWHRVARTHPDVLVAGLAGDIRRAHEANGAALFLCAQGGTWITNKLYRVEAFYRLGLRVIAPAFEADNLIAGGCLDGANLGLTRFGTLFVKEADRLGLLLDGAGASERTGLDLAATRAHPIVYSHANCKALADDPRNVTDEQVKHCVDRGGVIALTALGPLRREATPATVADLCDHVDHIARLTGRCDGIGIGSKLSSGIHPVSPRGDRVDAVGPDVDALDNARGPDGTGNPSDRRNGFDAFGEEDALAGELTRRGYKAADIEGILGGNLLRVFARVWKPTSPATGADDGGPEQGLSRPGRA